MSQLPTDPDFIPAPDEATVNRYLDSEGQVNAELRYTNRVVEGPDGQALNLKEIEHLQLIGGQEFNPTYSNRDNGIIPGICAECQRRARRRNQRPPMVNSAELQIGIDGRQLCPRHGRRSPVDHRWRTPWQHVRHLFWMRAIRPLFFRLEEVE